jgi:hypothetical protein
MTAFPPIGMTLCESRTENLSLSQLGEATEFTLELSLEAKRDGA